MRFQSLAAPLLASVSLTACSTAWKPPEIRYDDTPRQAVLQPDPPKPVQIVELPKPLPLPGQLKPLPGPRAPLDPADPGMQEEGEQPGRDGHDQVAPVDQGRGRRSADQNIADEPTAKPGDESQNLDPEDIQLLPYADQSPGDPEHEDAHQIKHLLRHGAVHPPHGSRRSSPDPLNTTTRDTTEIAARDLA